MSVSIPVTTKYNGKGVDQFVADMRKAAKESERLAKQQERDAVASTRRQIAEHKKVLQLTRGLDKDLAGSRPSFASRVGMATGISFGAVEGIQAASRFTIEYTKASILAANEAKKTERAFVGLSGGAENAAKNLDAMQRATRDLASEQEQQAIANQLLGMNIVKNSEDLEKVVSVSRRLGKEFKGLGAREAGEEFAIMISNMSVARLDSFGISSGNVRKRIDELLESNKGMTRETAFFQATMEEADKVLKRLGPEVETSTEKFERMAAKSEDLQTAFGKVVTVFGDASGIFDTASAGLDTAASSLSDFADIAEASGKLQDKAFAGQDGLKNLNSALDTAASAVNPLNLLIEEGTTIIGNMIFNTDELAKAQEELAGQSQSAADAAKDGAAANEADAAAMEDAARAAEELAKKLEDVNRARRSAVDSMLDIESNAQKDITNTWDKYYDDTQQATADHNDSIISIHEKSAEEQNKIQSRLTKDLAKEEADLARDIEKIRSDLAKNLAKEEKDAASDITKIRKDTDKQIARKEQDAARQERQQRRQRTIDAKGDERLFQYDMRQLAAEGDFNAILQAQERRAIEKQIEAEKQVEEDRVAEENSREEIKRIREDAEEQIKEREAEREERKKELIAEAEEAKQQRMAQAEERKAELRAQAEEEMAIAIQQRDAELAAEEESYQQRMDELAKYRDEKLQQIEESKEEAISKLAEELAESGDLTKQQLTALVPVAGEIGEGVGKAFADGISAGFERNQKIDEMLSDQRNYTPSGLPGTPTPISQYRGFATGGAFRVGGSGGADSQLVQFWATPGEEVEVRTPAQQSGGGGVVIQQQINIPGVSTNELANLVQKRTQAAAEAAVNEYHLGVIVPWTNS